MVQWTHEKEVASQIKLEMKGSIQEYALNFLHIFNNAKSNSNIMYSVTNDYENGVYVTCNKDCTDNVIKYLEQFGQIEYVVEIQRIILDYKYTEQAFNELYGDYDYTEFAINE